MLMHEATQTLVNPEPDSTAGSSSTSVPGIPCRVPAIVDEAVEKIALYDHRRAQFAAAHVGVLPIHFDDVATIHMSFRMRSSSAGLSQFRPMGLSINRILS